jgi:hypothetical protein
MEWNCEDEVFLIKLDKIAMRRHGYQTCDMVSKTYE